MLALGLSALACTGVMEGSHGAPGDPANPDDPSQIPDPSVSSTMPIDPGTKGVHRLNTVEYNATVQDVLGTQLAPATDQWRGGELGGFDNMAAVLGVDADQYERYFKAAEQLADDVFGKDNLRARFLPCAAVGDPACIKSIAENAGLRIFRRPMSAEEVTTYGKVYDVARAQGDDHNASAKLLVQALLSSAEFLYRIELDPTPGSAAKHPLNSYELASRLSYFLWSSAPDDQLLAAAANESLSNPTTLSEAVTYMLGDARSNRLVSNFAGQWLGARKVIGHPTAPDIYPAWNEQVAAAAAEEMYLYFNEFLRSGRSWLEFMKADINFVSSPLAAFYGNGMTAPATGTVRLENVNDGRAGFAGLVGFLAMSSPDRRTSPTLRGAWLLRNMMCTIPPDPPANIPELEEEGDTGATLNVREALEKHRTLPSCAGCHNLFDPFGLALEQYDGIGKFRTTYTDGTEIDPKTSLVPSSTYPAGLAMEGLAGAADAVTQNPEFATCISQKMLTYGLGRLLVDADKPYLALVNEEWLKEGATPSVARLVQGLVATETFRYRRGEGK
jgi:hypothetical protein